VRTQKCQFLTEKGPILHGFGSFWDPILCTYFGVSWKTVLPARSVFHGPFRNDLQKGRSQNDPKVIQKRVIYKVAFLACTGRFQVIWACFGALFGTSVQRGVILMGILPLFRSRPFRRSQKEVPFWGHSTRADQKVPIPYVKRTDSARIWGHFGPMFWAKSDPWLRPLFGDSRFKVT